MASLLFSIAVILVVIGCILLIFKFVKSAVKWLLLACAMMILASAVFGINLFTDIRDLQENFPKTQKLLLLKEGNTLLTGFEGKLFSSDDVLAYLSKEQLAAFQQSYSVRDIQRIRGDYFKVMIFDASSFEQLGIIPINGKNMPANDILGLIGASDTLSRAVVWVMEHDALPDTQETRAFLIRNFKDKGISSDEDMRAFLFAQLFSAALSEDPLFLINEFKNKNLIIYPETITFKLAKIIPTDVFKDLLFDRLLVKT